MESMALMWLIVESSLVKELFNINQWEKIIMGYKNVCTNCRISLSEGTNYELFNLELSSQMQLY